MHLRELFAKNLKFYRKQAQLSQMKLAELCESSTNYIGEIETGKKFPSPEMMEKLAEVLGVSSWCFLFDQEKPANNTKINLPTGTEKLSSEKNTQLSAELISGLTTTVQEILSKY